MKFIVHISDKYIVNKIDGKGLPSRGQNISLFLKKYWPDLPRRPSVPITEHFRPSMDLSPVLRKLYVQKQDKILDIGAYKNEMVETIQSKGFSKAVGIDVADKILRSAYGRQINFRDLSLNERYRVIHFSFILDHFPGGSFNEGKTPELRLLAGKIYFHLLPKGHLLFSDTAPNVPNFIRSLLLTGFKHITPDEHGLYIFQKD